MGNHASRREFHETLNDIHERVLLLFSMVRDGVAHATEVLLADDRRGAENVVGRGRLIDSVYEGIEALVVKQIALQAPVAKDMRFLVTTLQ